MNILIYQIVIAIQLLFLLLQLQLHTWSIMIRMHACKFEIPSSWRQHSSSVGDGTFCGKREFKICGNCISVCNELFGEKVIFSKGQKTAFPSSHAARHTCISIALQLLPMHLQQRCSCSSNSSLCYSCTYRWPCTHSKRRWPIATLFPSADSWQVICWRCSRRGNHAEGTAGGTTGITFID